LGNPSLSKKSFSWGIFHFSKIPTLFEVVGFGLYILPLNFPPHFFNSLNLIPEIYWTENAPNLWSAVSRGGLVALLLFIFFVGLCLKGADGVFL